MQGRHNLYLQSEVGILIKETFLGYYPPTAEEYERLWKDGLIVLDTNVLLNLYRLPSTAREELIKTLEILRERLWIPHQVALEFQRRRLTVISAERKSTEDALKSASELVGELKQKVDALQIDKRGLGIESRPLVEDLEKANAKLVEAIKAVHQSQLDIASSDPVREKLDQILSGRVGSGPNMQADLDLLIKGGEERFKEKIPPGFADADKDKNPSEATFMHDHLKYQRKFGDLILWRQLIAHTKEKGIKGVLLVTADKKEDWWWREQGKTIGPHPELVREISRDGGVDLFWMYSSVQFIEHANKYTAATVSSQSVAELQQVLLDTPDSISLQPAMGGARISSGISQGDDLAGVYQLDPRAYAEHVLECVASWLRRTNGEVIFNTGFPDLLIRRDDGLYGYEVGVTQHIDHLGPSPRTVNGLLRGYMEKNEGRLASFSLILVITDGDYVDEDSRIRLRTRSERLLSQYHADEIVVGTITHGLFQPLVIQRNLDKRRHVD